MAKGHQQYSDILDMPVEERKILVEGLVEMFGLENDEEIQ